MVIRRRKKSRKMRGSRTHGWGIQGQHRGSGLRGGVGKAGRKSGKHKWSWVLRYKPDYFGKRGFKRPISVKKPIRAINIGELDELADELVEKGLAERTDQGILIDPLKLGYNKVLGRGAVTKPLIIVGDVVITEEAAEKILNAGGVIKTSE